jgi:GT2 family glycosyltransferase
MSTMAGITPGVTWLGWDGRTLRFRVAAACAAPLQLRLDEVPFARIVPEAGECVYQFGYPPGGVDELALTVCDATGRLLTIPWRVRFGVAATVGVDAWHGPPRELRPLRGVSLRPANAAAAVAIVVPIHDSLPWVRRCIAALFNHTRAPARLILIDDASEDPAVPRWLAPLADHGEVVVRRNPRNLGYTRSCNLGIELAGRADVVLLNSDTEVGPRWLERLRAIAYADPTIGTVTAVSDNAGAFSVPDLERPCPIPAVWSLVQAQRALLHGAYGCLPQLPTGNGFCMYVKRELFDRVGVLDGEAFPQGYGEENDLCQRAEQAGYRHVIAGDVLVRHARSASFGDARRATLGAQGMARLRERYPNYEAKVGAALWSYDRHVLDWRVRRIYAAAGHGLPPRPRVLLAGVRRDRAESIAARVASTHEVFLALPVGTSWRLDRYATATLGWAVAEELSSAEFGDALARYAIELVVCKDEGHAWHAASVRSAVPCCEDCAADDPAQWFAAQLAAGRAFAR